MYLGRHDFCNKISKTPKGRRIRDPGVNMTQERESNSKNDLTNDLTGRDAGEGDNARGKAVSAGYGKDTGVQSGDPETAGGREGKFSEKENRDEEGLDTDWSPGANQPRS